MRPTLWGEPGMLPYDQALALQQRLVGHKLAGTLAADIVLCLEHPPVFTLGRRAQQPQQAARWQALAQRGVPVVPVGRGGDVTWHGPGQLVLYPLLDLKRLGLGIGTMVQQLEELMIVVAARLGVTAHRDPRNRGVWVGEAKLGSIGLQLRRGICFHGLAFNLQPDLTAFSWIDPCGLAGVAMTSIAQLTGRETSPTLGCALLRTAWQELFGPVQPVDPHTLSLETHERYPQTSA